MLAKRAVTLLVLLSLASVGLVSGCGGSGEEQDPKALMANPWQVTKYVDVNGRLVPPLATEKPGAVGLTIEFTTPTKLAGNSGINKYGGSYAAKKDGSIEIGPLASTMMAGTPEMMGQEDAFLSALERAASYQLENGGLTLADDEGKTLVRARPAEVPELERTDWVCTGYNNGQEAFVSIVADTEITARFEEGVLSGSAGVNNYNGKYTVDGTKLSIDSAIASTMIAGEPEAMDQESAYLATLPDVVAYKIQDNILTLYGAGGLRLVTYVPAP